MRIAIVTGPFYPVPPAPCGAVERMWQNLAEVFAAKGHEVTVLCRHWPGQNKNETVAGVRYIRRTRLSHTKSIYWDLLQDMWYSLRMLLLQPRADVTVTNVFWLPVLLRWRRKRAGALVVNVNRWPKGQMKLYRKAARLAAASGAIRDEIVRQCPDVSPLVKVLPNPIDTSIFKPPSQSRQRAAGGGMIIYHGRINPEKGVHVLVDAFKQLARKYPELRLRLIGATSVAGGGGGEDYVASLKAKAMGLAVELVDPIYDRAALARELQSADYYCYPSLAAQGEALPVAPIEAMATGLPPVVSALPVFRDYVEPERNGLVFNHESADAAGELAATLRRLIDEPQLRLRLGQAASDVATKFSNESVAEMYLQDFESLIAGA